MEARERHGLKAGGTHPAGMALRRGAGLVLEARALVQAARTGAQRRVRESLVQSHWSLGQKIAAVVRVERRAGGGASADSLIASLARSLETAYGPAYSKESLERMLRFFERYPGRRGWEPLAGLRWGHIVALLALDDPAERDYYAVECRREGWNPARLREEIRGRRFARTTWARGAAGARRAKADPPRSRAPRPVSDGRWGLDSDSLGFLGLAGGQPEDRRAAVIRSLEDYLLDLGIGLCFVERWKRFQVGPDDFYLDLVLYHRRLKRLIAVVLRLGEEGAEQKDLLEFYLIWLNRNERQAGEGAPVGLVLDTAAARGTLALRQLEGEGTPVAWYQTALPPRAQLQQFFCQAVAAVEASA